MSAEELALGAEKDPAAAEADGPTTKTKRTWWGGKKTVMVSESDSVDTYADVEAGPEPRRPMLLAPIYNGLAAGLSICELRAPADRWGGRTRLNVVPVFIGNGVNILLTEVQLDGNFIRLALCALLPLFFCISLVCTTRLLPLSSPALTTSRTNSSLQFK